MKASLLAAIIALSPGLALAEDFTGEWTLSSGAGTTPSLHCSLFQKDDTLSGLCATPDGPDGPLFQGTVNGTHASWGYDDTVGGRRSHVAVEADMLGGRAMKGVLTVSGKPSSFTAEKD